MPIFDLFYNTNAVKAPSAAETAASQKPDHPSPADIAKFHASLDNFMPTPLIPHPELASKLGVRQVFIKCETSRLGLPAYKILGASYAIYRYLGTILDIEDRKRTWLSEIISAAQKAEIHLCCATDGNHGRAVACMANLLGIPATVFVPNFVPAHTYEAIRSEGKKVQITIVQVKGDYSAAERQALKHSFSAANIHLIQDNSIPELKDDSIVHWIVAGYRTIFHEIDATLKHHNVSPSMFVVPVGVGSLAQAVSTHYAPRPGTHPSALTKILTVEPTTAACLFTSLKAGKPTPVRTANTIMTGLNCGSVSPLAFPILQRSVDFATTVREFDAHYGVEELRRIGIDAGPIAGACVSALQEGVWTKDEDGEIQDIEKLDIRKLGLDSNSVVVIIATEGRRAYQEPLEAGFGCEF